MKNIINKMPWGIFLGISAMLLSYCVLALVAVKVVSYAMIAASGGDDGLGNSWWIPLVIVGIVVFALLVISFAILYFIKDKNMPKEDE